MALFILFSLLIGLVGSVVLGTLGGLMLASRLEGCTQSRRFGCLLWCGTGAIATMLIIVLWGRAQFQTITPPGSGPPTPDDAMALLKAYIAFGLAPGLGLFSAGLMSLCYRAN